MRASRYLHVPPWELAKQPMHWQDWAYASEAAENAAQEQRSKNKAKKKK